MLVTRNLPPLTGGMERLIWKMAGFMGEVGKLQVVGPQGCSKYLSKDTNVSELPFRPLPLFLLMVTITTVWRALCFRPSVIVAGSGLVAPFVWIAARLIGARCVVYLHGMDVEVAHPLYRSLFRPVLAKFDTVVANSRFTKGLAIDAGVEPRKIIIIAPGVDLPEMSRRSGARASFRDRLGFTDVPLMLYVGRITARKGLAWFVENCLGQVLQREPTAKLIVIGDEPVNSVADLGGEKDKISKAIKDKGIPPETLVYLGELAFEDPLLDEAYFGADVHVFPVQVRPGDNEGFGMVAIEAAAHGLRTIAFSAGGVGDAVESGVSGVLVAPGDVDGFTKAVLDGLHKADGVSEVRAFAEKFSWVCFGDAMRGVLRGGH